MNKTPAKNQHYYPQMFLKGFCNPNNNIFLYDLSKNKISPRNIESVGCKKHLYTVSDRQGMYKNFEVEKKFSDIENYSAPLFEKIRNNNFRNLSGKEISQLIDFIVLTFIRTPTTVDISENVITEQSVLSEMRAVNLIEANKLINSFNSKKGLAYAVTLAQAFDTRHKKIIDNFDGFFLSLEEEAPSLLLNDNYTCWELMDRNIPYIGKDVDWSKIKVKMHFPISSRCCFTFVPKTEQNRKGTSEININFLTTSSHDAQIINNLSFTQAKRYTYCQDNKVLEGFRLHKTKT